MTESQAIEAIYQRWIDGWLPLHPSNQADPNHVPFVFDNEELASPPAVWARVSVAHTSRIQGSMGPPGGRRFEVRGVIAVQLFGAFNVGRKPLAVLADDVRSVLEAIGIVVGTEMIYTYASETRLARLERFALGFENPASGDYFQSVVITPFMYEQQR